MIGGITLEPWVHERLKEDIGTERYNHTLRVVEISKRLARKYGVDEEKASIAALLHDCGKFRDRKKILKVTNDFDIILDNVMKFNKHLIHGPLGAEIAKRIYNIHDEEILNAIYYHTTGREKMSLIEKIIYIGDYIEPGRDFEGVEKVRELVDVDLNNALLLAMDNTIKYVIEKGYLIHLDTVKARNSIKLEME